jgi:hypothetical protein
VAKLKTKEEALHITGERIGGWLKAPVTFTQAAPGIGYDAVSTVRGRRWIIVHKNSSESIPIQRACAAVVAESMVDPEVVTLIVVPFMGKSGAEACMAAGTSWLDLSGNARVDAPGLVVDISGKPNEFIQPGRPGSVFSPKSSRVVRCLLNARAPMSQAQLCRDTKLDDSFISKIAKRLIEDGLAQKNTHGHILVADRKLLLTAWQAEYQPGGYTERHIDVPVRTVSDLQSFMLRCRLDSVHVALTGAAAAWVLTGSPAPAKVAAYVTTDDSWKLTRVFLEAADGALTVTAPKDDGVFLGCQKVGDVAVVGAVQALLDLEGDAPVEARAALEKLIYAEEH